MCKAAPRYTDLVLYSILYISKEYGIFTSKLYEKNIHY